jgi:hypothetical protein
MGFLYRQLGAHTFIAALQHCSIAALQHGSRIGPHSGGQGRVHRARVAGRPAPPAPAPPLGPPAPICTRPVRVHGGGRLRQRAWTSGLVKPPGSRQPARQPARPGPVRLPLPSAGRCARRRLSVEGGAPHSSGYSNLGVWRGLKQNSSLCTRLLPFIAAAASRFRLACCKSDREESGCSSTGAVPGQFTSFYFAARCVIELARNHTALSAAERTCGSDGM